METAVLGQPIPLRFAARFLACAALPLLTYPSLAQSPPRVPTSSASASAADLINRIRAGTIALISDGDFIAATYATGRLAPLDAPHRDLLTVLTPASTGAPQRRGEVEVSNSVTAPPEVLSLSTDGRTAFVVERLEGRGPGIETSRQLRPGRRLSAIDLADKSNPRVVDTVELPSTHPEAVRVSPDGRTVAVVANAQQASVLLLVPFGEGKFGRVGIHDLAEHGVRGASTGPVPRAGGVTASFVDWHPSGRFLAVNVHLQNRVAFFELTPTAAEGAPGVKRWGNLVETGPDPFVGRFSPDGRHYLTADWGRDFGANTLDGRLPTKPSSISVIRLAEPSTTGDGAVHARVGGAETDRSSEGLAVSPDGRLVATVNMRETATLPTSPRFVREASVTLLRFDPERSELAKVADYPFEGVLPEGAAFDAAGENLLVTVFQYHEGGPAGGGLEVWGVTKGDRPALERLGRIPVPHGVHHVEVAR